MQGPQNGIIGNDSFGVALPQKAPDEDALNEIKKAAKYYKSDEFQKLKEHMQSRIDYYQKFLPDGRVIDPISATAENWVIANTLIQEFQAVINGYENAEEILKDESTSK